MSHPQSDGDHAEVHGLLGAYALHAVTLLEKLRVERHLKVCDECAREARLLGEASSELAFLPSAEKLSDDLVDRIVSAVPEHKRQPRPIVRTLAAVAAVALIAVGLLGATYMASRQKADNLAAVVAHADKQVKLAPTDGFPASGRIYVAGKRAALVLDNLPPAGESRTYQLWALRKGVPTSMGVFDAGDGKVVRIMEDPPAADAFAITVEPGGGSKTPTGKPVLLGT